MTGHELGMAGQVWLNARTGHMHQNMTGHDWK